MAETQASINKSETETQQSVNYTLATEEENYVMSKSNDAVCDKLNDTEQAVNPVVIVEREGQIKATDSLIEETANTSLTLEIQNNSALSSSASEKCLDHNSTSNKSLDHTFVSSEKRNSDLSSSEDRTVSVTPEKQTRPALDLMDIQTQSTVEARQDILAPNLDLPMELLEDTEENLTTPISSETQNNSTVATTDSEQTLVSLVTLTTDLHPHKQSDLNSMNQDSDIISQVVSGQTEADLRKELTDARQALNRVERLLERSHNYNEQLREKIESLSAELHAYRSAAQHRQDAQCQVEACDIEEACGEKPFPVWGTASQKSEQTPDTAGEINGESIADCLKATAQEAVWEQAGFVYDSASGLYYDYNSGYYYDSARSLYYDPNTTAYFYYDESEQTYKFHSYATQHQQQQHSGVDSRQGGDTTTTNSTTTTSHSGQHGQTEMGVSQGCLTPSPLVGTDSKTVRHKHHKHKTRERSKLKRDRAGKARRRTKSSKKTRKQRGREKTGNGRCEAVLIVQDSEDEERDGKKEKKKDCEKETDRESEYEHSETGLPNTDDSHQSTNTHPNLEAWRLNTKRPHPNTEGSDHDTNREVGDEVEVMEVESSDSLATGESEMETEPESGEITDSSSSSLSDDDDDEVELCAEPVQYDPSSCSKTDTEVSASYPPCIRVVVQSSDKVEAGMFYLVTCPGGTIGRDKHPSQVIHIPDLNVSKVHADIQYDYDNSCYTVQDLASQNGTFLNDMRISQCKEKSACVPLCHGDRLRVANTDMLLHIHPGSDTCDLCEPGQVKAALKAHNTQHSEHVVLTKEQKKRQARQGLKDIKKKYGLANSSYVDNMSAIKHPDYADKAELRRRHVGSEHPSHPRPHQAPASVHRPISTENKGHRMLAKMGWKEGSGLGKDNAGRSEPVTVELRANQTAGLGSETAASVSLDNVQSADKLRRILQTKKRYQQLESSNPQTHDND